jgi:hypothetical protein
MFVWLTNLQYTFETKHKHIHAHIYIYTIIQKHINLVKQIMNQVND